MKYASVGTVSHGTLRDEDLLDSFADELEFQVQRNAEEWCSDDGRKRRDAYLKLVGEAREIDPESDDASEIVNELFDALNDFAAPYMYFGALEGDGSDFGFWLSRDAYEDAVNGKDAIKVSALAEVPEDYQGDVFHVSDHGNLTLYTCSHGVFTEVWAIV